MHPANRTLDAEKADKDGLLWLLVGALGFFFGFSVFTGPLSWYFARRLKRDCEDSGVRVPDTARAAVVVGVVTTVITYALAVVVVAFIALAVGGIVTFGALTHG